MPHRPFMATLPFIGNNLNDKISKTNNKKKCRLGEIDLLFRSPKECGDRDILFPSCKWKPLNEPQAEEKRRDVPRQA